MGDCCASNDPLSNVKAHSLPIIYLKVNDCSVRGLIDSGCTRTIVHSRLVVGCEGETFVSAFDGRQVKCKGHTVVQVVINNKRLSVRAVVSDMMINNVDVVVGLDVIDQLGGVMIREGVVQFLNHDVSLVATDNVRPRPSCAEGKLREIDDEDFHAVFDGKHWTVEWLWKNNQPVVLKNKVSCYNTTLTDEKRREYDKEVNRWIEEGILVPWAGEVTEGIIPMMAVEQPTKNKVRPVMDFRELNTNVKCHTGDDVTDVCDEKMRQWRQMRKAVSIVDLKSAYLQIRVSEKLWQYQLVNYEGKTYCLTRLGFGLNCAPRIMSKILKYVLREIDETGEHTSSYIDDILVDESELPAAELISHLNEYGLITKPPESLENGTALGLKLFGVNGELVFRRGNEIPEVHDDLSRRGLFSVCGMLVGHYPIAGWLRVACSFIKRSAEGSRWEDPVGSDALSMIKEVIEKVKLDDPVKGAWHVPKTEHGTIWSDASSLAIGVLLEVDNKVVEDAAWLRKKDDYSHINVAELEAVVKGVNLALKWGLKNIELRTDSVTVHGWVNTVITEEKRVRTKGASEMVVKRRLGILRDLINEFGLTMKVIFVPSSKNKADILTRVRKSWLTAKGVDSEEEFCCVGANVDLRKMHDIHHMGVERTLYLAHKVDPTITKDAVRKVVQSCQQCQSIDPAPSTHIAGEVSVKENWKRIAIDVTHYRQVPYLSVVDCGPSRFAIWKELNSENAQEIATLLEEIFYERGPVDEILMDNGTVFRSSLLRKTLERWNIMGVFRAAYRPGGNGIVERHHRTVKAIAERGQLSPIAAVFWYNMSPRSGQDERSVPQHLIFKYGWRHPMIMPAVNSEESAAVRIGEEVWVKPPGARCTTKWKKGHITGISSRNNVSVDGMPRHILDVRKVFIPQASSDESEVEDGERPDEERQQGGGDSTSDDAQILPDARPRRTRRRPGWLNDYVSVEDDYKSSSETS